jgi:hypothetical protein
MNIAVLVLLMTMIVIMTRKYNKDVSSKKQARSCVFDECSLLLQEAQTSVDKANLPVLSGNYDGFKVHLSVVEDTLGWRKIPPLWLLIKVVANNPSHGTLDFIARPANNEFYSPSWQWDGSMAIPAAWPQHAILKYLKQPVDIGLLDKYVPELFADTKMKELLVTPAMTRLTYMIKQGERGEYLLMRNAVYDNVPVSKDVVESLLKKAIAIRVNMENAVI